MNDVVKRLRRSDGCIALCRLAANEIERLEKELLIAKATLASAPRGVGLEDELLERPTSAKKLNDLGGFGDGTFFDD